jgi:hypothetical protein
VTVLYQYGGFCVANQTGIVLFAEARRVTNDPFWDWYVSAIGFYVIIFIVIEMNTSAARLSSVMSCGMKAIVFLRFLSVKI